MARQQRCRQRRHQYLHNRIKILMQRRSTTTTMTMTTHRRLHTADQILPVELKRVRRLLWLLRWCVRNVSIKSIFPAVNIFLAACWGGWVGGLGGAGRRWCDSVYGTLPTFTSNTNNVIFIIQLGMWCAARQSKSSFVQFFVSIKNISLNIWANSPRHSYVFFFVFCSSLDNHHFRFFLFAQHKCYSILNENM